MTTSTSDEMTPVERAHFEGWCDAIDSVRASLQSYPNGGGDTEIMFQVERLIERAYERGKDDCSGGHCGCMCL